MTPIRDHARVLDDTSRERLRQETNLLPGILDKIEKGHTPMKPATKLRFAALLLALILLLAFFALPGVATALKRLLGYVPGVGTVDTSAPLRVLAEPVIDTRDGFTITVESALLDSTQSVIQYRIEGPFPSQEPDSPGTNLCQEAPILRLENGTQLNYSAGEYGGSDSKAEYKDTFEALPADQNQAMLILPCVRNQLLGEKPQNWEIPIRLTPAPSDMPVYPVLDMPTPTPPPAGDAGFKNGFRLEMEQMAEIPDGFYLKGRLYWQENPSFYNVELFPDAVRVVDSAGQDVLIWDMPFEASDGQSLPISLKISAPSSPGPVQVIVDYVALQTPSETGISLDFGENPQPGQTWEVNQDLTVQGYTVRVLSAEYFQESPQAPIMLILNLQAEPEVLLASFMDFETGLTRGGGGSPNSDYTPFRATITYEKFPTGKINLLLTNLSVRRDGPWSVTWEPPVVDPNTPARQLASPVSDTRDGFTLTVKSLKLDAAGSTITYLIQAPYPFDSRTGLVTDACIQTTSLRLADGREKTSDIREGFGDDDEMEYTENFPALSSSETPVSLVISCISGTLINQGPQNWEIPLANFVAAPPTPIPSPTATLPPGNACIDQTTLESTLNGPQAPIPSGLGGKLTFWQGNGELSEMTVSNLDGSEPISLGPGLFPSLSPDGRKVVYRASDNGLHIRDLTSGDDFVIPGTAEPKVYNNNPSWSPDGQQISFNRFADDNSDIYLVNADGSNLHKIVTGLEQQSFLGWAADSRSISYSTYEEEIPHVFVLTLQTGDARETGTLPPNTGLFSISPDGKRMVYSTDQGIFLTDTANFAPTLLFDNSLQLGYPLIWSPDGQWLAMGYWDAGNDVPARLALLQPDTCQFILFQKPMGMISSWVP